MVIEALFWILLPGLVYGLLATLLPDPGPPPWWRRAARRLSAAWGRHRDRRDERRASRRTARGRPPRPTEPDPFEALALQMRLSAVAAQLHQLETDPRTFGLGRRMEATLAAYDDLLDQARLMAGVANAPVIPTPGLRRRSEPERLADELELAEHGWLW